MIYPPPHLMIRIGGNPDQDSYDRLGELASTRIRQEIDRSSPGPVHDVLDWGCGTGRVAAYMACDWPNIKLRGCDPDAEAIAWCNENISGSFDVTELYPPLPYADESFDAIVAVSVMTHLRRRVQWKWLRELGRVMRPGGLFVATVHGRTAAEAFGITDLAGIQDHFLDGNLEGILPDDYYRAVLQTEEYTRLAWTSPWFEVVGYQEAAIELHDLVTCRRVKA